MVKEEPEASVSLCKGSYESHLCTGALSHSLGHHNGGLVDEWSKRSSPPQTGEVGSSDRAKRPRTTTGAFTIINTLISTPASIACRLQSTCRITYLLDLNRENLVLWPLRPPEAGPFTERPSNVVSGGQSRQGFEHKKR